MVRHCLTNSEICQQQVQDVSFFLVEFLGLEEKSGYSENDLETHLIDNLQKFLLELGAGYTFVARKKRFTFNEDHFRVDLVFYNRLMRCFVLIDLKIGTLKHQDLGQMQMYVNYYDRYEKQEDENPTIDIYMKLDDFRSRRPIDIIAKTNPILVIDEPQSVEGKQTKENLKQFNPLVTLRYSATHKSDSIYNMVYRLDAMEAYNKRLVKKIVVKDITESGSTATESYVYLESINLSKSAPTATIQFDCKGATGIRKITRIVSEGYNLYDNFGQMEEYKQGFVFSLRKNPQAMVIL